MNTLQTQIFHFPEGQDSNLNADPCAASPPGFTIRRTDGGQPQGVEHG
jgi:hypothetical protein